MAEREVTSSFSSLFEDEGAEEVEEEEVEVDEDLKVSNLGLCADTVSALAKRGISALFPIQKLVFQPAMEGRDLIGRAKTGSGKTLAFALPVIEALIKEDAISRPARGRPPRCLILAPTRELANQVAREFETACPSLSVKSFYGGVGIGPQMANLERGVDVVVGTPGRVIDLIERGKLRLGSIRFAILDEADQMLDMGFEQDMETILGKVPAKRQTMLFSATLPSWINKVARRFLNQPLLLDLVGDDNSGKLADTIKLLAVQVDAGRKIGTLVDLVSVYGAGGKTIVFTKTKMGADEVGSGVNSSLPTEQLHGDIPQAQRETTLARFRNGDYSVLVATDVASRGLDIPNVDLVVHYDLPQDSESFLHRSGRTGRAGKLGTTLVMYTASEAKSLGYLLRNTKATAGEIVGAPNAVDVMTAASKNVLTRLDKVEQDVIDFFVPAAERLLASGQPERVLAAALASMSGFRNVPAPRSLLNSAEGMVTFRIMGPPGRVDGFGTLQRELSRIMLKGGSTRELGRNEIGRIRILEDAGKEGVAFDIAAARANELLALAPAAAKLGLELDRPRSLPLDLAELTLGRSGGGRPAPRAGGYGGGDRRGDRRGGSGGYGGGYGSRSGSYGDRDASRSGSYGGGRGGYSSRGPPSSGGPYSWSERGRSSGVGGGDAGRARDSGSSGRGGASRSPRTSNGSGWGDW